MSAAAPDILGSERLRQLYRMLVTIRRFEEVGTQLLLDGKIPAGLHTSIGQEAVATGVCAALQRDDLIVSNHRGHGHCIAKGVELKAMMAELMGKASGTNGGRGGSMHIADPGQGILGANGIVGGGIPIALGAAYASRVRESRQVVACFFGDGAANEGSCHETMNMAALWKLPLLFVCEHNHYAEMTPQTVHAPLADLAVRAAGYNMPGVTVDGNDVMAVLEAVGAAAQRARSGAGPTFLECKTYRIRGHFEGDPQRYKPTGEQAQWKERDPIALFTQYLSRTVAHVEGPLQAIRDEVERAIQEAVRFAEAAASPGGEELTRHVYAEQ